ncbi:4'-phosphopantetheinyl transferase family protein [Bradyrhizobium roseum]|uniref:4'-phosphopantetheinyl transferase family protein n=1 Tax=Bradyrhizobium roseum TaxID=3056648 RepID=UPI002616D07B|nr:4'-phosphopantetheinyl transferase superfamily protein [Bradyrhizobium roseus]WKA26405.1 4'-phosphopantetheinyl transferase superfamily protein [Bradyrhizobium roseus]
MFRQSFRSMPIVGGADGIRKPLIDLTRDEIHLWLAKDEIDCEQAIGYRKLLSADERERERRFHFEKDRVRFLITRTLVRTVLSRYEPVDPRDWVFTANAYGCPQIDVLRMGGADIGFNISHTAGLVVLGVTRGRAVGVDVEKMCARTNPLETAHAFSAMELDCLSRLPAEQRLDRFFEYWTFKESYIKARGMGVSIPLDKVSVRLDRDGLVDFEVAPELDDDPRRWQFWQFRPGRAHILALCAERVPNGLSAILIRRMVSIGREEDVPIQFSRASQQHA